MPPSFRLRLLAVTVAALPALGWASDAPDAPDAGREPPPSIHGRAAPPEDIGKPPAFVTSSSGARDCRARRADLDAHLAFKNQKRVWNALRIATVGSSYKIEACKDAKKAFDKAVDLSDGGGRGFEKASAQAFKAGASCRSAFDALVTKDCAGSADGECKKADAERREVDYLDEQNKRFAKDLESGRVRLSKLARCEQGGGGEDEEPPGKAPQAAARRPVAAAAGPAFPALLRIPLPFAKRSRAPERKPDRARPPLPDRLLPRPAPMREPEPPPKPAPKAAPKPWWAKLLPWAKPKPSPKPKRRPRWRGSVWSRTGANGLDAKLLYGRAQWRGEPSTDLGLLRGMTNYLRVDETSAGFGLFRGKTDYSDLRVAGAEGSILRARLLGRDQIIQARGDASVVTSRVFGGSPGGLNGEGKAEVLYAKANAGILNDDGSVGFNLGAKAGAANVKLTGGWSGNSVGLSGCLGCVGFDVSGGVRDSDGDGRPEVCLDAGLAIAAGIGIEGCRELPLRTGDVVRAAQWAGNGLVSVGKGALDLGGKVVGGLNKAMPWNW